MGGADNLLPSRGSAQAPVPPQGLGMRSVLLIISEPDSAYSSTSGCSCQPRSTTPPHSASPIAPCHAAIASTTTSARLVGIGVPSKYVTLPASALIASAVTL